MPDAREVCCDGVDVREIHLQWIVGFSPSVNAQ